MGLLVAEGSAAYTRLRQSEGVQLATVCRFPHAPLAALVVTSLRSPHPSAPRGEGTARGVGSPGPCSPVTTGQHDRAVSSSTMGAAPPTPPPSFGRLLPCCRRGGIPSRRSARTWRARIAGCPAIPMMRLGTQPGDDRMRSHLRSWIARRFPDMRRRTRPPTSARERLAGCRRRRCPSVAPSCRPRAPAHRPPPHWLSLAPGSWRPGSPPSRRRT